ncbi:membrane lipoprotein lipid attachment site-containing protein [Domibacillus robiginosus]|uniref:membrane lipoprotein lipid attachment site-containing protein n=1 Tax=Domibacillus robiginosus TaxID=1071054 RepID=UPI00067D7B6F|nr:membrane lipoprotein lipid attachment site-containing protein [Domibacillus robiginosus]
MKRLFSILTLLFVLAGCSEANNEEKQVSEKQTETVDETESSNQNTKKDVYVPNPQITDDINLVKIGDTVIDDKGELTLKAYKNINKVVNIGAVEMTIKDLKVMHFVPDYSMIDFFHAYTHQEEFDFVKVGVEVKNTSNEDVKFAPVALIKTSNGEQKTWEDDIYLEELTGELQRESIKKGNMGFIVEKAHEVKAIEILTSDVVNSTDESIEKAKNIKIDL